VNNWNLKKIYPSFDSKEFNDDYNKVIELVENAKKIDYSKPGNVDILKKGLANIEEINTVIYNLFAYTELNLSVNQMDNDALKAYGRLQDLDVKTVEPELNFTKYTKTFDNLDETIEKDSYLKEYKYFLDKSFDSAKRLLSDETEILLSKLDKSSGSAWERLFDTLTSTLEVDYKNEKINLSEVRNLAYDSDESVRKEAYEAELSSYKKIDNSIAAALSSIKIEVQTLANERGFDTAIEQTLNKSGMTKKTLDALLGAIDDYLPIFRKYLKRKGELLGHKNGLPFYCLFAPMGKEFGNFSIEDSRNYLVSRFKTFNTEISSMMEKAYDNEWIDFYPREGKVGGAFCETCYPIKQSRILTNYDGTLGDVITLAHELGHAYHNLRLEENSILNIDISMPVAETASTFNEVVAMNAAISAETDKKAKMALIESQLMDAAQIICDIYSRYLFETAVFENRETGFMFSNKLCDIMLDAQRKAYGDGLDPKYLHPYMWACKSHYYSGALSFYNFPYAFGGLFARGLYAKYLKEGASFVPLYKKLLTATGTTSVEGAAKIAGIDLTDKEFWRSSMSILIDEIDEFVSLANSNG